MLGSLHVAAPPLQHSRTRPAERSHHPAAEIAAGQQCIGNQDAIRQRLEFLLHERLTKIDELTGTIDQQRERIRRLGVENEILTAMIAAPPVEAGSLRAELLREIKP